MLSARQLNRALLARQLLLQRSSASVVRAVEQVGGLQSQYSPSAYIGLWSRLDGFERAHLTRALELRRVVQGTLIRTTIHIVSAGDYPLFAAAIAEPRRASWLAARPHHAGAREMTAIARRVRRRLADGPKSRAEAGGDLDSVTWNGVGVFVDIVRVPPSGTWESRRADLYAAAEDWLGPADATADEGREHLLRRYLAAFGPATLKDAANWAG